jgi:uncharacterized protein (DUF433 family)
MQKLNLRSAVIAFRHLYERFGPPTGEHWSDAHVYVINKDVFAQKPDNWATTSATKGGQQSEMRVLGELAEEEGALLVPKQFSEYIEINPNVMDGEPVIKDTRVPTSILAMMFTEGMPVLELAELYSPISTIAIEKAIEFEKNIEETFYKNAPKIRTSVN